MITIDATKLLICLVLIALIILIFYLILFVKNSIQTVKNINKITSDASVVSSVTADRTVEINDMIGNLSGAVNDMAEAIKGRQSLVAAVTNLLKAVATTTNYLKSRRSNSSNEEKNEKKSNK